MEIFSPEFLSALLAIIVIDLVLAGDNAIVIAMAARNLPADLQKRAIIWGAVGAIGVRSVMTLIVVYLLKIPGLILVGGLLLVWIAYRLLHSEEDEESSDSVASMTFWGAMRTIIVADAVMGLDNVLAVAGAAQGSYLLVVLGLVISIPIVVWGSTLILKLVDKYPLVIYFGAGILTWTANGETMEWDCICPYPTIAGANDCNLNANICDGKSSSFDWNIDSKTSPYYSQCKSCPPGYIQFDKYHSAGPICIPEKLKLWYYKSYGSVFTSEDGKYKVLVDIGTINKSIPELNPAENKNQKFIKFTNELIIYGIYIIVIAMVLYAGHLKNKGLTSPQKDTGKSFMKSDSMS